MGEEAWRVRNVGEPCVDNLLSVNYSFLKKIADSIGLDPGDRTSCARSTPSRGGRPVGPRRPRGVRRADGREGPGGRDVSNGDPGSSAIIAEIRGCGRILDSSS